jgi:NADH dehydrogenase
MAGALAEIARTVIPKDFHAVDTKTAKVILVEGQDRLLPTYPEASSQAVKQQLEALGVEVLTNTFVTEMDANGVQAGEQRIDTPTIFWAAGVQASPLGKTLGVEMDRVGHVVVGPDLTIENHPEVFVIGDLACAFDGETKERVPGVAQGAIQMGKYVAEIIKFELNSGASKRRPFTYKDKGNMATIGRNKAVAVLGGLKFRGRIAWFMWAMIHVLFLVSFRNRFAVVFSWFWSYLFFDRGARLITGDSQIQVKTPRDLEPTDESSNS